MAFCFAAQKAGMTQIKEGSAVFGVTILKLLPHEIVRIKTEKSDGYSAVVFSAGSENKKASKPVVKAFEKINLKPRKIIFEERLPSGSKVHNETSDLSFEFLKSLEGQVCDVASDCTKGKGFSGGMKRWNFAGLRASHGVSVSHRSHGSTGNRQDPGRVFKGKKMAGHYGAIRATVQAMKIAFVDLENGIIGIKGGVPGSVNGVVFVRSTTKGFTDYSSINNIKVISENDK